MSGGHLDYIQYRLSQTIELIESDIAENLDGKYGNQDDQLLMLKTTKIFQQWLQDYDYCASGNTGPDDLEKQVRLYL